MSEDIMVNGLPSNRYHRILQLQVSGGFLDGLNLKFRENLNCIIGGRGTGKTTVLEGLRWALDQMPDPKESKSLYRKIDRLIQANLEAGTVEVEIETLDGIRYRVKKTEDGKALVLNDDGEPVNIEIGRGTIFSAEVYSQSQIEEIANDPLFQLKIIDKFIAEKLKEVTEQIRVCLLELHANSDEILKLRGDLTTLKERVSELPEVTEKLKAYKVAGDNEEAKAIQTAGQEKALREQEKRTFEQLQEIFSSKARTLRETVHGLPGEVDEHLGPKILQGANGELIQQVKTLVDSAATEIVKKVEEAALLAESTGNQLGQENGRLTVAHLEQEKAYQDLLALSEKGKHRATERDQLLRRQAELLEEQKKLEKRREELTEKEQARQTLLHRLSDMKDLRFSERMAVAKRLSDQLAPTIRVRIEQYGNTDSYRDLLLEAMKGSGFKYSQVVERIVQRIPPQEFAAIVQRGDAQALTDLLEIDDDRSNRLILQLKNQRAVFETEVVDLHDRPTIELKDGSDYKDSTTLSTGQKCTTILPILLLENASPLLIDQPEDNLDNAFIYDTVVKSVRGVRGKRQLLFVTHNPNIPVLGDAQQVIVMQSTGRVASAQATGTVDDVKDEIETILEGGREAFQKRIERYGY